MVAAPRKHLHVCSECGFQSPKWFGRCPSCGDWNALVEEKVSTSGKSRPAVTAHAYAEIQGSGVQRMTTGNSEVDRTLGGGIVPGSLILLGGEPGIGKSTLLLQVAESLSNQGRPVLYVAGEESVEQIRLRGDRLQVKGTRLYLLGETCLERILDQIGSLRPSVVIVDSIQTMFSEASDSIPGSISQIRDCAAKLLVFAKREGIPVLLIGHITKDGALAGPKALEHIVDVVLYFEGTRHRNEKIVRASRTDSVRPTSWASSKCPAGDFAVSRIRPGYSCPSAASGFRDPPSPAPSRVRGRCSWKSRLWSARVVSAPPGG